MGSPGKKAGFDAVFGPGEVAAPSQVQCSELKELIKSPCDLARAFKRRCDSYFLDQVERFASRSVWAPFPLAVMTCIGIEMIGVYKYGEARHDSNRHFRRLVEDMDAGLREEQPAPDQGKKPLQEKKPLSDFIYEGFRNSLAHGYYGQWVYITHDDSEAQTWLYEPSRRVIVLNVYWFYQRFREVYQEYFRQLLACTNPSDELVQKFIDTFKKKFAFWL